MTTRRDSRPATIEKGAAISRLIRRVLLGPPVDGSDACMRDGAMIGPALLLHRCPGSVRDGAKRRDTMGDKGGKKDKEKGQKQNSAKHQQMDKAKQDKQPKKKLG